MLDQAWTGQDITIENSSDTAILESVSASTRDLWIKNRALLLPSVPNTCVQYTDVFTSQVANVPKQQGTVF